VVFETSGDSRCLIAGKWVSNGVSGLDPVFEALKYNSLGQISHALCEVGGEFRRNM